MISATSSVHRSSTWLMFTWLLVAGVLSLWLSSSPLPAFAAGLTWLFLAGLTFTHWFNRAIFGLFFAELILGGRGRSIEIHDIVPIRLAIGIFLLVAFLSGWFADGRATNFELRKSRACLIAGLMGAGTFLFFGLFLGRVYGNPIEYIVGDCRGFLFLVGSLPLLFFATRRKPDLNFVVGCFLSIVGFYGVAKLFGYTLVLAQVISIKQLFFILGEYIPQDVNIWTHSSSIMIPRLFLAGDFWLMFSLPLFVSLALVAKSLRMRVLIYGAISILFIGLVASQTRGLWLGALLALAVVFWLSNLGSRLKIAVILPFLLMAVFALSADFLPSVQQTIVTSFDLKESSNRGRIGQFAPLMDMVRKHAILGNGFGSYARDHPGPDPQAPWSYELQAMDFLMKMGVVGCGSWGLFVVWLLHGLWRIYKRAEDPTHRAVVKGLLGGLSGMLFASVTNPYFSSSPGMGSLLFTVVLSDMLREQVSIRRRKENGISQGDRLQPNALASLGGAPSQVR